MSDLSFFRAALSPSQSQVLTTTTAATYAHQGSDHAHDHMVRRTSITACISCILFPKRDKPRLTQIGKASLRLPIEVYNPGGVFRRIVFDSDHGLLLSAYTASGVMAVT